VKAQMLMNYAALDDRVNATAKPWAEALKAAKVRVEAYFYEGAQHAFNNDTSAERYNKAAADLAWNRMITLFGKALA
jgi:carboxymethylenebutenolidase